MALKDYAQSKTLAQIDPPFYALIIAAIQRATDEDNAALTTVFQHEIGNRPYDALMAEHLINDEAQFTFEALMMAAIRNADTNNTSLFELYFPALVEEMKARYHAPGGVLPGDE
jgi:hypothetical protein